MAEEEGREYNNTKRMVSIERLGNGLFVGGGEGEWKRGEGEEGKKRMGRKI